MNINLRCCGNCHFNELLKNDNKIRKERCALGMNPKSGHNSCIHWQSDNMLYFDREIFK